jgi:glutathione S-transferase
MKLLTAGPSPFVRKVRLVAAMKGLTNSLDVVATDAPDIAQLRARNPLGKVPILFTDDDATLFDSQVICEYLDSLVPAPRLFPADGPARWQALTLGALADGILESALLLVYEGRYRPEDKHVQSWMDMQQDKIDTALRTLEASPPHWDDAPHYGHATLACALGYLDFRHGGHWRAAYPAMLAWLEAFAVAVPAFEASTPA